MDNISVIRNFMNEERIRFLLVNSTNEFLVEYNTLEENSRYKLTNFSGSTGEALVTPDKIYLFVDGRYHIQADLEVDHNKITVVKMENGSQYMTELLKRIPQNETLGIFSKKNSQAKYEYLSSKRNVILLKSDPLDDFEQKISAQNIHLDESLTGLSTEEKFAKISHNLKENEAICITDLDEVSYFFNLRNFSQNFSAKIRGKCLISKDNYELFLQDKLPELENILKSSEKNIYIDKSSITAYDYSLIKNPKELKENPIKIMKSQKNEAELKTLQDAFAKTDKAVSAIRDYIQNNENLSEYDIAQQLEKEFKKQGAAGLSFNSIVAKDKNSALAHYSKSSKNEIIKNGSLVLIDCGGYFEGGLATDITRVFVKGEPSILHKKIYTLVLKAFLRAYNYLDAKHNEILRFAQNDVNAEKFHQLNGYEIDSMVHTFFDEEDCEGFVFNHGLGHGLGINVHEYPPNLSQNEIAKTPILDGMCFSIEPGLYKQGAFGIRLENSCYFKDNKIHSFVKMNYEKKLINFDMLTEQELKWLEEFEVK